METLHQSSDRKAAVTQHFLLWKKVRSAYNLKTRAALIILAVYYNTDVEILPVRVFDSHETGR